MSVSAQPDSPGVGYRLLSLPLYLFWILHGLKHGLKHGTRDYLAMRMFGFDSAGGDQVWVHASSVGETRAVAPLVRALIEQGESIIFTSFTATGYRAIRKQFPDSVAAGVIPFDNWWHCRRFFARHSIKLGLVMETELWPELLYQARRRGMNLLLLNARLSRKSLDTSGFVRRLLKSTLGYFTRILTRGNRDLETLLSLGADADRITRTIAAAKSADRARLPVTGFQPSRRGTAVPRIPPGGAGGRPAGARAAASGPQRGNSGSDPGSRAELRGA
jgi:3-deoxy-D-manno-octulosonic-acid transferase